RSCRRAASALPGGKPQQRNERLGVLALGDRAGNTVKRPRHDLDSLVLLGRRAAGGVPQVGGQIQPHALVTEAGTRVEREHLLPRGGLLADLLGELALGGFERG